MMNAADNNFIPSSIQLDRIGATFWPIACIAVRSASRHPSAGKNARCHRRLITALSMIVRFDVPVVKRTNVPPKANMMKHPKSDHAISMPITCFNAMRIRSGFFAPQFCPIKVDDAVEIVARGCIMIPMIRREAVWAEIIISDKALFALWKMTEPRSTTQYISAMAMPFENNSAISSSGTRKSSLPGSSSP